MPLDVGAGSRRKFDAEMRSALEARGHAAAYAIIRQGIYVRAHSLLRKIEAGIAGARRASLRQRAGKKDLRKCLATGMESVDGTLQDVAERVSPEPGAQAGSGSNRAADGAIFLRRRSGAAGGICSADALSVGVENARNER